MRGADVNPFDGRRKYDRGHSVALTTAHLETVGAEHDSIDEYVSFA